VTKNATYQTEYDYASPKHTLTFMQAMSNTDGHGLQIMLLFIMINEIREKIETDIFDYQMLISILSNYAKPRDKISSLLKLGHIISLRQGLYMFSDQLRRHPVVKEVIAGMLYGPSYISSDYALSYYGLIPEKVSAVTSVTIGRSRKFTTPVGRYTYEMIPQPAYSKGMDIVETNSGCYMIATPEKALTDKIALTRGLKINSITGMYSHLIKNMRIDTAEAAKLDTSQIDEFRDVYQTVRLKYLLGAIRRIAGE
jgi:predicted transcriptional regulator of viral defense system